jgi:ATP-dependent DNA ligase
MLATLAKDPFSDPAWVFEAKLTGSARCCGGVVRPSVITRNEKDRTSHYPDLAEAILRNETAPLIADGEIVAFRGDVTSFSRLQERMQNARDPALHRWRPCRWSSTCST